VRAVELVDLEWSQVDFKAAVLHVRRAKKGTPAPHPLRGDELRALRWLQREQTPSSSFIFTSERGAPFSTAGFAKMIERAGVEAGFDFKGTCCETPAASLLPMPAMTPALCRRILDTATSSIRCGTPSSPRAWFKDFWR
jgi:integrase